jgi:hypothetical protein
MSLVCARCVRPAMFKFKIGAYTYCEECVEKEPKWKKMLDGTDDVLSVGVGEVKP